MDLAISKAKVKIGIKALEQITPPNTCRQSDFATRLGNNTVVHRIVLVMLRNGMYQVKEFKYNLPHSPQPIIKMDYREIADEETAIDSYENKVSEFEAFGFKCMGSKALSIVDLFEKPFYRNRFTGKVSCRIQPKDGAVIQRVVGGIHCYLKVNQFGDAALHEINHINESVTSKNIITPYLKCYADYLLSLKDFRGALIEGFATQSEFFIIDAAFIGVADLRNKPLSKRLELLPALLGTEMQKFGVYFCSPIQKKLINKRNEPGYLIQRNPDSQFSLVAEKNSENYVFSHQNILALETIENKGGTVLCHYSDNEDLTYTFDYLDQHTQLLTESYSISESSASPPIVF